MIRLNPLRRLRRLAADRRGATVIEYTLIIAIISVGVVVMANAIGSNGNTTFTKVAAKMG
jgi:Flp pilus assembly pilin Flp